MGIITLICKDPERAYDLKFWRLISLLCLDYKIISKCLTNRVKRVMGNLIDIDQTAAVVGRSIQDNIHLLRNILDYSHQKHNRFILLSLDQSKAFDRVDHSFMFQVIKKFGFGPDLMKWVGLLYTQIRSTVLVNGFFTGSFEVTRSVRQGCSLSSLLYVLCIEPFASKVRLDVHIRGFSIPGSKEECRISQYADDCTFTVMDKGSVLKILNISELYGMASGARLKKDKSVAILVGDWGVQNMSWYGIKWSTEVSKICGVYLGNGDYVSGTWDRVWVKCDKVLNLNSNRNLRLRGKSVILSSLAMSKLWHVGAVFPIHKNVIDKFQSRAFKFVWNNKVECLKRESLYNEYEDGGINLINIECKLKAFLVLHVCKFLYGDYRKWHDFALYWLKIDLREYLSSDIHINSLLSGAVKSVFYDMASMYFKEIMSKNNDLDFKTVTVKKLYHIFLETKLKVPRIINVYPTVDFNEAFKNLCNPLLSCESRDVSFRIVHHILPVTVIYILFRKLLKVQSVYCV